MLHKNGVEEIKQAILALPMIGKMEILEWLEKLGDELYWTTPDNPDGSKKQSSREVVEIKRVGAKVYQLEKVRCGKGACKSCPHGPYWYGYQRTGKRLKSWYIGKDLKKEFEVQVGDRSDSSNSHESAAESWR